VRSVFLQGLLLGSSALPDYFQRYAAVFDRVRMAAAAAKMTVLELALAFLLDLRDIDHVIFGVTRVEELSAIVAAAKSPRQLPPDMKMLACDEPGLINPSLWPASA
jgi:aryl-alcohol dehydrogenase-like predicted oxidoreductase